MRTRALSKTYQCIQSFKHVTRHFKKNELASFVKNFKVPKYLYFSGLGSKFDSLELEKFLSKRKSKNLALPEPVTLRLLKLKTFFSILPLSTVGSLIVRNKILSKNSTPFHPRVFKEYKNTSNGLSIKSLTSKLTLPKKFNLFDLDYKLDLTEVNAYLPIKVSKVSRVVSYNPPDYSHIQDVKPVPSLFMRFFNESTCLEKGIRARISKVMVLKDYLILPGSYCFTQQLLNILGEPAPSERFSYDDMIRGIEMFSHLLPANTGYLALPESWACATIKVNRDSYSGYMSSKIFGRCKGNIIEPSGDLAVLYYEFILNKKGFCFDVFAWSLGGREKRASITKTGIIYTRDTWMIEDVLNRVISPVNESFMDMVKEQGPDCPLFLGKTITQGKSLDFIRTYVHGEVEYSKGQFTKGGWIIPIDYSKFSLRIYEELIVCAMCVLSSFFNMKDPKVQKLMLFITNSVINKNLVLPESGLTYQFTKGIPSGHSLTSVLNTIVNFIIVSTALSKAGLTEKERFSIRFLCAGDDTLIYVPFSVSLQVLDRCFISSGMKMDLPSEVAVINNCRHPSFMPVFLKRSLYDYHKPVVWNESSLFENLVAPNKSRDLMTIEGIYEEMERVYGLYKHAPFNEEHNTLMFQYVRYLESLVRLYCFDAGHKVYSSEFIKHIDNMVKRRNRARSYKSEFNYPGFIPPEYFPEEKFSRVTVFRFRPDKPRTGYPLTANTDPMLEILGKGNGMRLDGFHFKKASHVKVLVDPP
jgi:hypothetical protein